MMIVLPLAAVASLAVLAPPSPKASAPPAKRSAASGAAKQPATRQPVSPAPITASAPPAASTAAATQPAVAKVVSAQGTTLAAIRARGTLRLCAVARAPWLRTGEEGGPEGYLAEIGRLLAADMGVEVEFVKASVSTSLTLLSESACDVAAGLSPTAETAAVAHFSTPLVEHSVEIVASRKSADDLEERKEFDKPEITFGVLQGSPDASDVRRSFPRAKLRSFAQPRDLEAAVAAGTVHAMLAPKPLSRRLIRASKGRLFRPFDKALGHRREGLAVRVGDVELLAYLDTWIQAHLDDHALEDFQERWLDVGDRGKHDEDEN